MPKRHLGMENSGGILMRIVRITVYGSVEWTKGHPWSYVECEQTLEAKDQCEAIELFLKAHPYYKSNILVAEYVDEKREG